MPVGVSVGAIYGIFKAKTLSDIKSGNDMVAAGYALFSACLQFVWAEDSVSMSMYKPSTREWIATASGHQIPPKGKTYSINEGSAKNWNIDVATFVEQHLRGRSVRWAACMVLDVHRNLVQGGCFIYPMQKVYKGDVCASCTKPIQWHSSGRRLVASRLRLQESVYSMPRSPPTTIRPIWRHTPRRVGGGKFEEAQATSKRDCRQWGSIKKYIFEINICCILLLIVKQQI